MDLLPKKEVKRPEVSELPVIDVQGRDFLASLSRIIQISDPYFRRMFENDQMSHERLARDLD